MGFQNRISMENDLVELGVGTFSRAGTWETLIDLGISDAVAVAHGAGPAIIKSDTDAPEYPETSYGITIGIVFAGDEGARLVSVAEFCVLLDDRNLSFMDEDYFDETLVTELTKFTFDPFTGTAIKWNQVEQLVMGRNKSFMALRKGI